MSLVISSLVHTLIVLILVPGQRKREKIAELEAQAKGLKSPTTTTKQTPEEENAVVGTGFYSTLSPSTSDALPLPAIDGFGDAPFEFSSEVGFPALEFNQDFDTQLFSNFGKTIVQILAI